MSLLTEVQLRRLRTHQYAAENRSMLDPYLQPWWNYVVTLVPMWVAPNLITVVGLMINIATSVLYVIHAPQAKEEVAWWVPFSCGMGLFIYQTLDAIDGKQARRTGSSNSLGELFDHGCDSMSTVVVSMAGCCLLGLGEMPYVMLYQSFAGSILFYLAHWQTYVTGRMRFGSFDVTEAQIAMIALMFITAALGSNFWGTQIFGFVTIRWLPLVFATVAAMFGLPQTMEFILFGGAGKNGSTVAGTSVIAPIVPVLLIALPGIFVALQSDLYENFPVLFNLIFGVIGSKITNKLIVAQMTKSEMNTFDLNMAVPWTMAAYIYFEMNIIDQQMLIWLSLVFVILDLLWYCRTICLDICNGCGWYLFKINRAQAQASSQPSSSSASSTASDSGLKNRKRL